MDRLSGIAAITVATLATGGCGSPFYMGQQPSVAYTPTTPHMSEKLRNQIRTVSVVADDGRPVLWIDGDYGASVPTVGEGTREGAKMGARAAGEVLSEDPRAWLLMPIILPVAIIGGSVVGASAAKFEQELQAFRNGLADELAAEDPDRPMPNERLAEAFTAYLHGVDGLEVVAEGADAEIKLAVTSIDVITDEEDAVIRTNAYAVLRSGKDASVLYSRRFDYSERDTLRNWAADDAARWVPYAEHARNYFAAEMAADLFETIHVRHVLRPAKVGGFSGQWSAHARSLQPTLAWELFLLGDDEHANAIDAGEIIYDLRIFDDGRLLYEARRIPGNTHKITLPLPDCRSLAWTVRPVYRVQGKTRAGSWMSYRSGFGKLWKNQALQQAPKKPEFWEDYARLRTRCAS
jgi:hypothetical protein